MSNIDVIVRTYQAGDEDKIVDLLVKGFNGWPRFDIDCSPREHWNWKFIDNPLKKQMITVAQIDDRIVGCDHLLFNNIKIGKNVYPAGQAADSAVHPEYRGLRIYSKVREVIAKNELDPKFHINFVYAASTNPIILKKEDKLGSIEFPYQIVRLIRILDINLHLRSDASHKLTKEILIKYGYNAKKILNSLEKQFKRNKRVNKNLKIVDVNRFDEKIDIFWDKIKDKYCFITERSEEYLNWRYCDHRAGNYTIKQAVEDGELIGYIVFRINNRDKDYPTGYIVDLCTLPDRIDCAHALIAESLRFFDERKINIVSYVIDKGHLYEALFGEFGFLNSQNNLYVNYTSRIDSTDLDYFSSPRSKLLFQYGDIDWI